MSHTNGRRIGWLGIALVGTLVLVGWRSNPHRFITANLNMKKAPNGETLTRGGSHEWDTTWGVWPYAYSRDWQSSSGSTHHEWVRVDAVGVGGTVASVLLVWVVAVTIIVRRPTASADQSRTPAANIPLR